MTMKTVAMKAKCLAAALSPRIWTHWFLMKVP